MTSIPASRSARAITLAPRSWPSRPGLATKTRILPWFASVFTRGISWRDVYTLDRRLLINAINIPKGRTDFSESRISADGFNGRRHRVIAMFGSRSQAIKGVDHRAVVSTCFRLFKTFDL